MPLQEKVLVEKDLQSNSKAFHLIVDFNQVSFPTLSFPTPEKSVIHDGMNKQLDTVKGKGM